MARVLSPIEQSKSKEALLDFRNACGSTGRLFKVNAKVFNKDGYTMLLNINEEGIDAFVDVNTNTAFIRIYWSDAGFIEQKEYNKLGIEEDYLVSEYNMHFDGVKDSDQDNILTIETSNRVELRCSKCY